MVALSLETFGSVKVIHGANVDIFAGVVGVSVAGIRASLVDAFNIPSDAVSLVNGEEVSGDFKLRANDTLEFIRQRGRKGVGDQVWTDQEFCQFFKISPEDLQAWIAQGLKVKRCLDGSIRITETAVDEFNRGFVLPELQGNSHKSTKKTKPIKPRLAGILEELPEEVSTEDAAKILGQSKDTVLKYRESGLLEFRNAAPPDSTRPVFRFTLQSVLNLRKSYETNEPAPRFPKESPRRRVSPQARKYKHVKLED